MKRILPIAILLFVCLLYTKPYFNTGYFPTHDGEWAVIRTSEMKRELKDLQIPPRFSGYLNHGYGYPLFNFTYPMPFYITAFLNMARIGLIDSVKTVFVLSVFLSAIFMYLLGRELGGNFAGFLSSLFYVVAPFRLVDLYVRGSIGESVSLALFPLLCYIGIRYILRPSLFKLVLCASVLALLILSHNIMALIFFPLWIIFLYVAVISYFEDIKIYTFRYFLPVILLGLGLACYFFLPALAEKSYVVLSTTKLADKTENFISLPQYLLSPWSYGAKPSFQLGWAHILSSFLGLIGLFLAKEIDRKKYLPLAIFTYVGILLLVFFSHPFSTEFWNVPPLSWFDFPWRLLTPLAFFLALSTVYLSIHKTTRIIGGILAVITIILSLSFAKPSDYTNKPDSYYATNDATTTSMDELMPIWVKKKPTERFERKVVVEGPGTVSDLFSKSDEIKFQFTTSSESVVKISTVYFPGWIFKADNKEIKPDYDIVGDGLIRLKLKSGDYKVEGKFSRTPVRFIADVITLLSIFVSFVLLILGGILNLRKKSV
jgi:hypothetical protein